LLGRYSGAAQEMIRKAAKYGLDEPIVLCSSNGNFSPENSFRPPMHQNWEHLPTLVSLLFSSSEVTQNLVYVSNYASIPIFLFKKEGESHPLHTINSRCSLSGLLRLYSFGFSRAAGGQNTSPITPYRTKRPTLYISGRKG